uniref:Transmembrane protein n=1 Tax=Panagrolaimus superbus TaxID=310955 RepID=A0A914YGK9_9BILA
MGKLEAYICSIYAFVPAVAFFCRFVAKEPLRIILFMIGAFFWLCSLLLTSVEWRLINILTSLPVWTLIIFVINQEIARILFFIVARKAYDGLTKLGTSNQIVIPEVELLAHSSRHTFSFVCGLGFGTIACFFSVANVIADLTIDGVPGLPASVEKNDCPVHRTFDDVDVPYAYAMSCSILIFLNAAWTILQWDSCYKFLQSKKNLNRNGNSAAAAASVSLSKFWWFGLVFGIISHFVNSAFSLLSIGGWHWYILVAQALLLLITTTVTMCIVGFKTPENWKTFFASPLHFSQQPSSAVIITNNDEEDDVNRNNEIIHQPQNINITTSGNNVAPEAV